MSSAFAAFLAASRFLARADRPAIQSGSLCIRLSWARFFARNSGSAARRCASFLCAAHQTGSVGKRRFLATRASCHAGSEAMRRPWAAFASFHSGWADRFLLAADVLASHVRLLDLFAMPAAWFLRHGPADLRTKPFAVIPRCAATLFMQRRSLEILSHVIISASAAYACSSSAKNAIISRFSLSRSGCFLIQLPEPK